MTTITGLDEGLLATRPTGAARDELGQEDFLKLMIAQFRNQDPFEPMDNGEFLGQLAQFGTVNGIDELKTSFTELGAAIQSEQVLQAANLVGRSVLATSDVGYLPPEGTLSGAIDLPEAAGGVQVEITDAAGEIVKQINLGVQQAGLAAFEWDGRDADGLAVETGHYSVSARALIGHEAVAAETLVQSNIESVNLGRHGAGMTLNLAGGDSLSVSQVRRIL